MATVSRLAVIVAQHGADVSACLASHRDDAYEVVQQAAGETSSQLSARVRERLSTLVSAGCQVHSASFVARSGFNVRDVMAAAGLLRGLVSVMIAAGTMQVNLHADPSDIQTRYALTALAEAMTEQLQGTGVDFLAHLVAPRNEVARRLPVPAPVVRR